MTLTLNGLSYTGLSSSSLFDGSIGSPGAANIALTIDPHNPFGLELQGANYYTGPTTLKGSVLELDFSQPDSPSTNIISPSSNFQDGGTLYLNPNLTIVASQAFNNVTLLPGSSTITVIQRTNATGGVSDPLLVYLGQVTRTVGSTMNFVPAFSDNTLFTNNVNTNGMLGGWATINGTSWIYSTEGNVVADIPVTSFVNDAWSSGSNVTVTTNSTQTNAVANSLRFGNAASDTVTLTGTNTLTSGGILISSTVGANNVKITGGTLEVAAGADLIVNQWDGTSNSNFEIDSVIADNTSATALTKAGTGTLILDGSNTYTGATYVDNGVLSINSNANLGSPSTGGAINFEGGTLAITGAGFSFDNSEANARPISVGPNGGTLSVPSGTTVTASGVISGEGILVESGPGTFILTNSNSLTGGLTINGGNLELANANAAQDATVTPQFSATSALTFSSGIGTFVLGGLSGTNSVSLTDISSNPVTLEIGNNDQSTTYKGILSGSGGITKIGTGTLTLSSATTSYLGTTQISVGALAITTIPTGGTVINNASLIVEGNSSPASITGSGTTTIAAGTLTVSSFQQSAGVLNNGVLQINGRGILGTISGSGAISIGTGTSDNTVTLASGTGQSIVASLVIASGSALDLTNNHLFISYGSSDPVATIRAYLASGYNNGHWNGTGIISSSAQVLTNGLHYGVGFADGADGVVSGLSFGEIEVKYTLLGDANLDGTVNGSDFSILAANFGLGVTNWDQGNFLYGSSVNGSDFSALAANFGQGDSGADVAVSPADVQALDAFASANGLPLPTIAAVPEPGCVLLLSAATTGALLRRRRKRA